MTMIMCSSYNKPPSNFMHGVTKYNIILMNTKKYVVCKLIQQNKGIKIVCCFIYLFSTYSMLFFILQCNIFYIKYLLMSSYAQSESTKELSAFFRSRNF